VLWAYNVACGWQRVEGKPQMAVYRRGGKWWIDYYDRDRNRVQESSYSSKKADADALLALRKSEILRGVYKRPAKISFGEFAQRYMEHAKANKRSWLRDEQMLKQLKPFFGTERQLTEITAADIEGYKLRRKAQVSGSTVNRELALLKRLREKISPIRKPVFSANRIRS
jgi:uncharacterized protein with gpF-like domain